MCIHMPTRNIKTTKTLRSLEVNHMSHPSTDQLIGFGLNMQHAKKQQHRIHDSVAMIEW